MEWGGIASLCFLSLHTILVLLLWSVPTEVAEDDGQRQEPLQDGRTQLQRRQL